MNTRFAIAAAAVAYVFVAVACDDFQSSRVSGSPTAPGAISSASSLRAEPLNVVPEFFPSILCPTFAPFGARLSLVFGATRDVFIQNLGFSFLDRFGQTFVPTIVTGSSLIPVPNSSPVPLPNSSPLNGVMLPAGTAQTQPVFLQFGCGVPAAGTLSISLTTADRRGAIEISRTSVRIGN